MPSPSVPEDWPDVVEALFDALNARDFDALGGLIEPDFEFRSLLAAVEGGDAFVGIDGVREWAALMDATWEDFRVAMVDVREVTADQAVVAFRNTGRARASGVPVDTLRGQIVTRRNGGPVSSVVTYVDPSEALRAAGLAP
jgi:ketosteroid isomerase-like protein